MESIETIFTDIGGTFLTSPEEITGKLKHIKAFLFDWDGVFNNGEKNENGSSNFSEVDSMGTNMLRFSSWLQHKQISLTAIISGERNSASFSFATREHFNSSYYKILHKIEALDHFCKLNQLKRDEIAYVFDDVLDISIAKVCGLRILVNRKANPLFSELIRKNNWADYITAAESGNFAVRETCELLMGLTGNYDEAITCRSDYTEDYKQYLGARDKVITTFFMQSTDQIIEKDPRK